jgi:hypothetical protein
VVVGIYVLIPLVKRHNVESILYREGAAYTGAAALKICQKLAQMAKSAKMVAANHAKIISNVAKIKHVKKANA